MDAPLAETPCNSCNAIMDTVRVNLGPRSYDIRFGAVEGLGAFVREAVPKATQALIVSDVNVTGIAGAAKKSLETKAFRTAAATIPSGESSKSFAELQILHDALAAIPADRNTVVVAVGGGVTGDLAGFAAATFNRGIPLVIVPTTLLAMVDSSVGGKTGINHAAGKNLIGSFHQPRGVWIDLDALKTLPEREYRSGLAEVVKYGVILDAEFFVWLEANAVRILERDAEVLQTLIARCCRLKAEVVEKDEREETGLRAVLNYGHTFGHAYETLGDYATFLHGEAVSLGMVAAANLAVKLGRIDESLAARQSQLLTAFGLPIRSDVKYPPDALIAVMRRDKKSQAGQLRFVLPTKLGHVELVDGVPESLVRDVLA